MTSKLTEFFTNSKQNNGWEICPWKKIPFEDRLTTSNFSAAFALIIILLWIKGGWKRQNVSFGSFQSKCVFDEFYIKVSFDLRGMAIRINKLFLKYINLFWKNEDGTLLMLWANMSVFSSFMKTFCIIRILWKMLLRRNILEIDHCILLSKQCSFLGICDNWYLSI